MENVRKKHYNANTILHTASEFLSITWHSWFDFRNLKFVLWIFMTVSTAIWKESFHKSLYHTYLFRCCFSSCCVVDNFRVFHRRHKNANKGMDYGRSFPLGILKEFSFLKKFNFPCTLLTGPAVFRLITDSKLKISCSTTECLLTERGKKTSPLFPWYYLPILPDVGPWC